MGFRGQEFVFDSPGAAVEAMRARIAPPAGSSDFERCPLSSVRGRVVAETIVADRDSPPFDASSMDGYAVRAADVEVGMMMRVRGESRIGTAPPAMPEGPGAIRIATGAGVPEGADCIVKREDVVERATLDGGVESITIGAGARAHAGEFIRRRGENGGRGDVVVEAGSVVTSAMMGTMAAVGAVHPAVWRRVRIAIVSTGDEVVPPEREPGPFQIRDTTGAALGALFGAHAWIDVVSVAHARDGGDAVLAVIRDAVARADVVVVAGGVSMGHRDPVRSAVEALGAEIVFHGLPQRPGKPMLGAILRDSAGRVVPMFGLPGNPVSSMVTALRIVIPVVSVCAGITRSMGAPRVALANADGASIGLWWHRLVRIEDDGRVSLIDGRGSGDVIAAGRSDGFIEVAPKGAAQDAGYPFYAWPM